MPVHRVFSLRARLAGGLFCAWALVFLGLTASPHASELGTITLLDQIGLGQSTAITDVWGWIHPLTGREYALIGDHAPIQQGFWVVDITNPSNLTLRKHVIGIYGFDVKSYNQYVYTVPGYGGPKIGGVVNLLDLDNPIIYPNAFESAHNMLIDPRGWMFLSDATGDELFMYDVRTTPTAPTFAWRDNTRGGHDISIKGNWLYDFHGFSFTRIYDISNPAAPVLRGQITDANITYHHSGYPTEDFKYLFITDELSTHPQPDITVWDIQDLANPFKVAEIGDSAGTVHNLYIVGDYAHVSYYRRGYRVYDVSDPTHPRLADEYDTHGGTNAEGLYDGAFGVYPFTQSGVVLISDEQSGLFVFDFQPGTTPVAIQTFVAVYLGGYVRLDWSLATADGLEGFHIYRSREADRGYVRLNETLIGVDSGFRFDDYDVEQGQTYHYRMGAIDRDGEVLSQTRTLTVPIRPVRMGQNFPNPFNPTTTIEYEISSTGPVTIAVYDLRGEEIRSLVDEVRTPGIHRIVWDGRANNGAQVATGIYFYRMAAEGEIVTRRLALIK